MALETNMQETLDCVSEQAASAGREGLLDWLNNKPGELIVGTVASTRRCLIHNYLVEVFKMPSQCGVWQELYFYTDDGDVSESAPNPLTQELYVIDAAVFGINDITAQECIDALISLED